MRVLTEKVDGVFCALFYKDAPAREGPKSGSETPILFLPRHGPALHPSGPPDAGRCFYHQSAPSAFVAVLKSTSYQATERDREGEEQGSGRRVGRFGKVAGSTATHPQCRRPVNKAQHTKKKVPQYQKKSTSPLTIAPETFLRPILREPAGFPPLILKVARLRQKVTCGRSVDDEALIEIMVYLIHGVDKKWIAQSRQNRIKTPPNVKDGE